ncbi:DNA topoisomerase 1 [Amblyomma americanum]
MSKGRSSSDIPLLIDIKPARSAALQPKNAKTQLRVRPTVEDEGGSRKRRKIKKEGEELLWRWWEDKERSGTNKLIKWHTLEHKGPVFAPPYERLPRSVRFYYDGAPVRLSVQAEEVAGFYARMLDRDCSSKRTFNENFFHDWRRCMTMREAKLVRSLAKCDFAEINAYYKGKAEERKAMTAEQEQAAKRQQEKVARKYGFCVVDGHRQKIANYKIEPPGLFCGRGEHPKMGMLKRRVMPEDVTINIGREAALPRPPRGHRWKEVRHDTSVSWLASWNVLGQTKYVVLNPGAKMRGQRDMHKYELARRLKHRVHDIRRNYTNGWKSRDMRIRQLSVALYFIDRLALRAGNEKEEGRAADTVGCCSLRVEHITLHYQTPDDNFVVQFDFLGKDAVRYVNAVAVDKRVFDNLELFIEDKEPEDDLFDLLSTGTLNKHLNELMEGLTAKVFRTYNASKTFEQELDFLTDAGMSVSEKVLAYNRANRAVAILCNHRRTVPKNFAKQMENLRKKMEIKEEQIQRCQSEIKQLKLDHSNSRSERHKVRLYSRMSRLLKLEEQLAKLELQAADKEENKDIAMATSKLNYIDPRISVAWCKTWDVPIENVYNKTQREKFRWAIEMADADFKF